MPWYQLMVVLDYDRIRMEVPGLTGIGTFTRHYLRAALAHAAFHSRLKERTFNFLRLDPEH